MQAYQQGETAALETLVRRHADNLMGYLCRMTRSREQAEDLFQETFLRVHTRARSFHGTGRFKAWLFSIATHLTLDSIRRRARHPEHPPADETPDITPLAELIPDRAPGPADTVVKSEQARLVREALDTLPPGQRAALVLAFYEGHSYPEAARILGCTVGTVKTHISRALRTLAARLPDAAPAPTAGGMP